MQVRNYVNPEGKDQEQTSKDIYLNIMLDMQTESDIYAAWEKDHSTTVDNYEFSASQPRVKLTMTDYLRSVPPVLIL